jgi:hypothetical protein
MRGEPESKGAAPNQNQDIPGQRSFKDLLAEELETSVSERVNRDLNSHSLLLRRVRYFDFNGLTVPPATPRDQKLHDLQRFGIVNGRISDGRRSSFWPSPGALPGCLAPAAEFGLSKENLLPTLFSAAPSRASILLHLPCPAMRPPITETAKPMIDTTRKPLNRMARPSLRRVFPSHRFHLF